MKARFHGRTALRPRGAPSQAGFSLHLVLRPAAGDSWPALLSAINEEGSSLLGLLTKWNKTNIPWWSPERNLPGKTVESPHPSGPLEGEIALGS